MLALAAHIRAFRMGLEECVRLRQSAALVARHHRRRQLQWRAEA